MRLQALIGKAQTRTHEGLLPKIAVRGDSGWTIRNAPPTIFHMFEPGTLLSNDDDWLKHGNWREFIGKMFRGYRSSLSVDL